MAARKPTDCREKLVGVATELIRRDGYVATSVDSICQEAGVTKGAFFHHFPNKESVAEECLREWGKRTAAIDEVATARSGGDPLMKVEALFDLIIEMLADPQGVKSCLVGTVVQEVSESHPALREASNRCMAAGERRLTALLKAACADREDRPDAGSLARLWLGAMQGALVMYKASRNEAVIAENLQHVKQYILAQLTGTAAKPA